MCFRLLMFILFSGIVCGSATDRPRLHVFVLAGQSNMQGHGFIAADLQRNNGMGSLERLAKEAVAPFPNLIDSDGLWKKRDDVWISYFDRLGQLEPGYGVREDRIGPELGFGWAIGDRLDEPVLLIKVAWGGRSLAVDFRPPSAGQPDRVVPNVDAQKVGLAYREMVAEVRRVLRGLPTLFPTFANREVVLAGFGWHQGWNDRISDAFNAEYTSNLAHFIRDVRRDLESPNLPFVIAETGMNGPGETHPRALSLMKRQAEVAEMGEFRDNVAFVPTRRFWRSKEVSPTGQGYHWNSNAETYYRIGDAMGEAMLVLMQSSERRSARVSARLQIINGSDQPVDVYQLKPGTDRERTASAAAGTDTVITATLGQRFVVVGREDQTERNVTSDVSVQGFRFDPSSEDGIPGFYTQRLDAGGFPVVASARVNPYALKEAVHIIDQILANRSDVRRAMVKSGARLCILAHDEFTTDQPEFARLAKNPMPQFPGISGRDYWDSRARGLGGSETDPFCSCGEENLLGYPGDPYESESILIHELAHNIHLRGMLNVDSSFDGRLIAAYEAAMRDGLWKGKYASVNHHEYFAEGVQSWFDDNRENDHDHNHVNTRVELIEYDPRLAELCREVFGDTEFKYTKPATRLHGHMDGYDPTKAPTFEWPERLDAARQAVRAAASQRAGIGNQSDASD